MLKLTQVFLLTDGNISRLSEIRRVFEDDKVYNDVFREKRLGADSRHVLLCYKVQYRLRRLAQIIEQKGANKYAFIHRSRSLLWALLCQGLLNHPNLDALADEYGTSMGMPNAFLDQLSYIAKNRVAPMHSTLMSDEDYKDKVAEGNLSFLRTDVAFQKCMKTAYQKWHWTHKKLQ